MKLHLPVRLFRAVIALMLATPAALYAAYTAPTAITIPSGYTQVTVDALADITPYSSAAGDVAFLIDAASLADGLLTINGLTSALMTISTDSWYFTSYSAVNLASLTFSNATTQQFSVYSGEELTYTALKALLFDGNQHTYSGGAIYGDGSSITLSGNESVKFSGNTASSTSYDVYGGAIYVCNGGAFTLSKNGSVTFSGNTASSTRASAYGGAIYGDYGCTIILSGNGNVTFSGRNKATNGGAIYGENNSITLSGNGSVTFSENTASSQGGAIYGGIIATSP